LSEILSTLKDFWKTAEDEWAEWRERAERNYKFVKGGEYQWDSADLQALKRQKKPALTFNKIRPIIRNLSGYQRQNREEQRVLARKGGLSELAEVFTELLKYFYDASNADWELSTMFMDGLIAGKGWIALDIDYSQDPITGDLVISRQSPLMVYEDPTSSRYDLSDAKFIIRCYWADKTQIELNFPEKKKELEVGLSTISSLERTAVGVESDDYKDTDNLQNTDFGKYRYLVKEYWWREYITKKFLIANNNLIEITDVPEAKINKIIELSRKAQMPVEIRYVTVPVLRLTTIVGDIILQDIQDPFNGVNKFPLVRFCPDWVEGYVKGEIDDLIDPQKEVNKRRSQALHLLNTSANSGYIVEDGALEPEEEKKLQKMGSSPGIFVKANRGYGLNRGIYRIEPTSLSNGHITLERFAEDDLKKISGVNADLLGYVPERGESGRAMLLRKEHGLITTEIIFDNFRYTQKVLGETLLEFIRKTDILSDEEIMAIVGDKEMDIDIGLLKNKKIGKYSITLTTRPTSPTVRLSNFYMLLDAVKAGLPIPPELLLEYSDLPGKDEMLAKIKQQQAGAIPEAEIVGGLPR